MDPIIPIMAWDGIPSPPALHFEVGLINIYWMNGHHQHNENPKKRK